MYRILLSALLLTAIMISNALAAPELPDWYRPFTPSFTAVTYEAGRFIAGGRYGVLFTSPDGENWTHVQLPTIAHVAAIAAGGGRIVLSTSDRQVLSSADGKTWTVVDLERGFDTIAYGAGRFVAGGGNQTFTSVDGVKWEATTHAELTMPSLMDESEMPSRVELVAYGDGQFFATDSVGRQLTSADGVNWTLHRQRFGPMPEGWILRNHDVNGAAFGNGQWVLVGSERTHDSVGFSVVGVPGSLSETDLDQPLLNVAFAGGRFVAVGDNGVILSSTDGKQWTREESGTTANLRAIAAGAGKFVAVGDAGTILVRNVAGGPWRSVTAELQFPEPEVVQTDFKVTLDGEPVAVEVVVANGRSLVPVRAIAELLGAEVDWVQEKRTVTIVRGDDTIWLPVGPRYALVNAYWPQELDVPAVVVDGRTRVPLRFIAETLGVTVEWNAETKTVEITTASESE